MACNIHISVLFGFCKPSHTFNLIGIPFCPNVAYFLLNDHLFLLVVKVIFFVAYAWNDSVQIGFRVASTADTVHFYHKQCSQAWQIATQVPSSFPQQRSHRGFKRMVIFIVKYGSTHLTMFFSA